MSCRLLQYNYTQRFNILILILVLLSPIQTSIWIKSSYGTLYKAGDFISSSLVESFTIFPNNLCFVAKETFVPLDREKNGYFSIKNDKQIVLSRSTINTRIRTTSDNVQNTIIDNIIPIEPQSLGEIEQEDTAFQSLAFHVLQCLLRSDLKRKGGGDGGGSTGWTSWVDDASAFRLQCCIDLLTLATPTSSSVTNYSSDSLTNANMNVYSRSLEREASFQQWLRWMKSSPAPMIVELSDELRNVVSSFIVEDDLLRVESTKDEILNRIGLQLIILPSGQSLPHPIQTAPGGMIYGKLLYGGCKRYRLLPGGGGGNKNNKLRRRTGERTTIKLNERENVKSWLQYGGPERNYESMDIGSCALLEISILPKGLEMKSSTPRAVDVGGEKDDDLFGIQNSNNVDIMNLSRFGWDINNMIDYYQSNDNITDTNTETTNASRDYLLSMSGKERNNYIQTNFTQRVGGLSSEIQTIVRRVMDGRFESEELQLLGLSPVRGLLLYGPPGCGKTALAREISKALAVHISSGTCNEPKIVSAPELLDRWVGGSEKLIRQLFNDAENELKSCGGDATKSSLHVIVIDEIDAVFRKRTSSDDSAQVTRASAVNQILAKLDGVNAIPNVLLIGMTNRRELLDEALLRPGRLEVQILIPKPDREGRREILQIHFEPLRKNGRLSQQLCQAIDGGIFSSSQQEILAKPISSYDAVTTKESDNNLIDTETKKLSRLRGLLQLSSASTKKIMRRSVEKISLYSNRDDNKKDGINVWRKFKRPITDLAADHITGGFTGADVAGLVRCAGSIALSRARNEGFGSIDGLLITLDDVMEALEEVKNRET